MRIYAGQIYVQPDAAFSFSVTFQRWLGDELSKSVEPSDLFSRKYGSDFSLIFRISAKTQITGNEIRGPTVFRKARDLEFTVFLPFNVIQHDSEPTRAAMAFLMDGILAVLDSLEIATDSLEEKRDAMIERAATDPAMMTHDCTILTKEP